MAGQREILIDTNANLSKLEGQFAQLEACVEQYSLLIALPKQKRVVLSIEDKVKISELVDKSVS